MNQNHAQRRWKSAYITWAYTSGNQKLNAGFTMAHFRREAALERKIEAANRDRVTQAKALEANEELIGKLFQRVGELERQLESVQGNNQRVISDHDARMIEQCHERM